MKLVSLFSMSDGQWEFGLRVGEHEDWMRRPNDYFDGIEFRVVTVESAREDYGFSISSDLVRRASR